jgi:hypothetical protein
MPQWIAREYLARRGHAKYRPDQLEPARCALLGYAIRQVHVEGRSIPQDMLLVNLQAEVGDAAYDKGAETLYSFFHRELQEFLKPGLSSLGQQIVQCCLDRGRVEEYQQFVPAD